MHPVRETSSPTAYRCALRIATVFVSAGAMAACSARRGAVESPLSVSRNEPRVLDDEPAFAAAVRFRGASDCSGVLVGPAWVLTAAHCVVGLASLPSVVGVTPRGVVDRSVDTCAIHPRAFAGPARCLEARSAEAIEAVAPSHDLAMLHLVTAFGPEEITPASWVARPPDRIAHTRVRVMSWLPSELTGDEVRRVIGWNEVTNEGDGLLVTVPVVVAGRDRVSTQPGDSGSPALAEIDGALRVVGVLSGGSSPYAIDSVFTETFEGENAAWIGAQLTAER